MPDICGRRAAQVSNAKGLCPTPAQSQLQALQDMVTIVLWTSPVTYFLTRYAGVPGAVFTIILCILAVISLCLFLQNTEIRANLGNPQKQLLVLCSIALASLVLLSRPWDSDQGPQNMAVYTLSYLSLAVAFLTRPKLGLVTRLPWIGVGFLVAISTLGHLFPLLWVIMGGPRVIGLLALVALSQLILTNQQSVRVFLAGSLLALNAMSMGSRASAVALAFMTLLYAVSMVWPRFVCGWRKLVTWPLLIVVATLPLVAIARISGSPLEGRMNEVGSGVVVGADGVSAAFSPEEANNGGIFINTTGRLLAWNVTQSAIREKPILGWGMGSSQDLVAATHPTLVHPHNEYLRIAHDFGLLGLFLLAVVLAVSYRILASNTASVDKSGHSRPALLASVVFPTWGALALVENFLTFAFTLPALTAAVGYYLTRQVGESADLDK